MSFNVKALVLAAVAALAVGVVGCGGDEKKAETPPAATGDATAAPADTGAAPAADTAAPATTAAPQ